MKKRYSFFAKWRKQDVKFLNSFNLIKTIKEGYDGFWIEEGEVYEKIMKKFSGKKNFFSEKQPLEFSVKQSGASFSQEDLDNSKYFVLASHSGDIIDSPLPKNEYQNQTFDFDECNFIKVNKKQKAPFKTKTPIWKKNKITFSFDCESDFLFFKKEFYQEILAPLGLKYIEVINHATGKPIEDTIQLDIPIAESKILIEGSAYDIYEPRCGVKQYARQYLDFFPSFEEDFDFHICYTKEELDGGNKRIIISKEFCELLVKHNIIKYEFGYLVPMKKIIYD